MNELLLQYIIVTFSPQFIRDTYFFLLPFIFPDPIQDAVLHLVTMFH